MSNNVFAIEINKAKRGNTIVTRNWNGGVFHYTRPSIRIHNYFDTSLYRNAWNDIRIANVKGMFIDVNDYLRFHSIATKMQGVSFTLKNTTHNMSVKVAPYSFLCEPTAFYWGSKVYYGVEFVEWGSPCHFEGYREGDTIYMRMDIDDLTGEFTCEILACSGCGRPIMLDNYIVTDDTLNIYCKDCEGDYYYQCDECGEYFDSEYYEAHNNSDMHICYSCFDNCFPDTDGWYCCYECDEVYYDYGYYVHNNCDDEVIVCECCRDRHYAYCDYCEEYYPEDDVHYLEGVDRYVCEHCEEEHFVQCSSCGNWVYQSEATYDDDDNAYCEDCGEGGRRRRGDNFTGRVIRRYHGHRGDVGVDEEDCAVGTYDMPFLVATTRQLDPTIGSELEADVGGKNDDNAEEVLDIINRNYAEGERHCIASEDASIRHGFELVSCPAQLYHHKNTLDWEGAMDKLKELGYQSHDCGTCGIHTHIDRDFFEGENRNEVDSKFIVTLQNNFWWLRIFSRRDDCNGDWEYCAPNTNNYLRTNDKFDKESVKNRRFIDANKTPRWCHRLSVNVTHTNTIEVRLYRGTLVYDTFIATLECSDLWARLVKGKSIEESTEINLKDFIDLANKMGYEKFLSYLDKRNIKVENEPKRRVVRFTNTEDYIYIAY